MSHSLWTCSFLLSCLIAIPSPVMAELPPIPGYQFEEVTIGGEPPTAYDRMLDARTILRVDGCHELEENQPVLKAPRIRGYSNGDERTVLGRAAVLRIEVDSERTQMSLTLDGCFEPEVMWVKAVEATPRPLLPYVADVMMRWDRPITLATRDQLWRFDWSAEGGEVTPEPWMSSEEVEQKLISLHGRSPWPEGADGELAMSTQTWWAPDGSMWFLNTLKRGIHERWWLARIQPDGLWELLIDPSTARVLSLSGAELAPWVERQTVNINSEIALMMQGSAEQIRDNMLVAYTNPKFLMSGEQSSSNDVYTGSDGAYYAAFRDGAASPWRIRRVRLDAASLDLDLDGLTMAREEELGTSDFLFDSDGDTSPDAAELFLGTDPASPDPIPAAPRALGSTRAIMEWEPLRHYRIEDDGIIGMSPPSYVSLSRDGTSLCRGRLCVNAAGEELMLDAAEAAPPGPLLSSSERQEPVQAKFMEEMEILAHPSLRQTLVWSSGPEPQPVFNPMHMARALHVNLWPVEVRLKSMHELPGGDGYVLLFNSNQDEVPSYALLNRRFGLVGQPFLQGMPSGIQGVWGDEGLFAAGEVSIRRASSNPEGGKCICASGGCLCSFEKTRERYVAAPEVQDNVQYLIHAHTARGFEPGDVAIADGEGSIWRRTSEGSMVLWLHTRAIQRALNLEEYERPIFSDMDATRQSLCLVSEGRVYTVAFNDMGEFASMERVAGSEDASACAHDKSGALIWATQAGALIAEDGEEFARLPGEVAVHELWSHPGTSHTIVLGQDEALYCMARDGQVLNRIEDIAGATQAEGITYLLTRSGELTGANTDSLCASDTALEKLLAEPFRTELWRQLHMGITMTILDTHTVSSPEVEMVARAPDHILVAINKVEMDTSAFVGTVTFNTFRLAPSYPERGEVMGHPELIGEFIRGQDFFSLADDRQNQAMAVIPGEGQPPADYRRAAPGSINPEEPSTPQQPLDEEPEGKTSEGCGQCISVAPHSSAPHPWRVAMVALCALVLVWRRRR